MEMACVKLHQFCDNDVYLTIEKSMKGRFSTIAKTKKISNITMDYNKEN